MLTFLHRGDVEYLGGHHDPLNLIPIGNNQAAILRVSRHHCLNGRPRKMLVTCRKEGLLLLQGQGRLVDTLSLT